MGANDLHGGRVYPSTPGINTPKKNRKPPGTPATLSVQARGCKGRQPLAKENYGSPLPAGKGVRGMGEKDMQERQDKPGNVKKCAVEKSPKSVWVKRRHPFFGVERSGTEKNGCGAARRRQKAADCRLAASSRYFTGGRPIGFAV